MPPKPDTATIISDYLRLRYATRRVVDAYVQYSIVHNNSLLLNLSRDRASFLAAPHDGRSINHHHGLKSPVNAANPAIR